MPVPVQNEPPSESVNRDPTGSASSVMGRRETLDALPVGSRLTDGPCRSLPHDLESRQSKIANPKSKIPPPSLFHREATRALVQNIHSHDERNARRCGDPQPSTDVAGGADPAIDGRGVHVFAARLEIDPQGRGHRPRGDEP